MRVVVSWDGCESAEYVQDVIARIVAKYPNAVFLIPEHWNGAHGGTVQAACVEQGACTVTFHMNRKKLGDDAYIVACRRAVIEGMADWVVIVGYDNDLDIAASEWDANIWRPLADADKKVEA